GRAARHVSGEVILYADRETKAIKAALEEVTRRREIQLAYNKKHGITPEGIHKPIRDRLVEKQAEERERSAKELLNLDEQDLSAMTPGDTQKLIKRLKKEMRDASRDLNFELAARLRDFIAFLSEEK